MSELLFIKQVKLGDFFVRRFNRVIPTCWLFIACMAVYAASWQRPLYEVSFRELVACLTFFRTYFPADLDIWAERWSIGHLWSLNVEEHSYVFLAIGAFGCAHFLRVRHAAVWFLALATIACISFHVLYSISPPTGASPWNLRSECASLGLLAASFLMVLRRSVGGIGAERVLPLFPILTLVVALACFKTYSHKAWSPVVGSLALAITLVWLDRSPTWLRALLSTPLLRWCGRCSFSLYLWQEPFYLMLQDKQLAAFPAVGFAIGLGALSFYLVEDPARRWLNERWAHHRRSSSSQALKHI